MDVVAQDFLVLYLLSWGFVGFSAVLLVDFEGETWREEVLGVFLEDVVDRLERTGPTEARIVTYKNEGNIYF